MNRFVIILAIIVALALSCTEKSFVDGGNIRVRFSDDTVYFDTVFTSIGTVTRELRIINPYKAWLRIDRVYLASGSNSPFRLNIDGVPGQEAIDIELPPGDSIFIFVDANIDPNNAGNPIAVNDSIIVEIGQTIQEVNLLAWGQDIHLINSEVISGGTWSDDKPWVIYNSMLLDTGNVLTIEEGTRIFFHRGSTMYVAGTIDVNGTKENPVIFSSDRREAAYADIPGQWQGIYFIKPSNQNNIDYAIVENSVSGIHLGNLGTPGDPPELEISNSIIRHMSVSGISSLGGTISAWNCLVYHCGFHCLFLAAGGTYDFNHCTIADEWDYSLRLTPAVALSDYIEYNDVTYMGVLKASFGNSVISGNMASELGLFPFDKEVLDVSIDNCLLKIDIGSSQWDSYDLSNSLINIDPLFIKPGDYDYRPDTLSPLIDNGDKAIATVIPYDLRQFSRIDNAGPDIGAYERQIGEISDKW